MTRRPRRCHRRGSASSCPGGHPPRSAQTHANVTRARQAERGQVRGLRVRLGGPSPTDARKHTWERPELRRVCTRLKTSPRTTTNMLGSRTVMVAFLQSTKGQRARERQHWLRQPPWLREDWPAGGAARAHVRAPPAPPPPPPRRSRARDAPRGVGQDGSLAKGVAFAKGAHDLAVQQVAGARDRDVHGPFHDGEPLVAAVTLAEHCIRGRGHTTDAWAREGAGRE